MPSRSSILSRSLWTLALAGLCCVPSGVLRAQEQNIDPLIQALHLVSEKDMTQWMLQLTSDEFRGRLTGDIGYTLAANWAAAQLRTWGLQPMDGRSYLQAFPQPYTQVEEMGSFTLHIPAGNQTIDKQYAFPLDYMPGGVSDSGTINAELVYVGFGVTAPELGYDDYKGVDVKGKIVVFEPDVPNTNRDPQVQKNWMPYQYHTYKMKNAIAHGAVGLLYITTTGNPNPGFNKDFVYCGVSEKVAEDIFAGTGKTYADTKAQILKTGKPASFAIAKRATISAKTTDHPEGVGYNVVAFLPGSDPQLSKEVFLIGAHLDHIGMMPVIFPGANDNASGTAIIMGVAKALAESKVPLKRSVAIILFGGEEMGLVGSQHFIQNPLIPMDNLKMLLNIDCLNSGYGLACRIPDKWKDFDVFFQQANDQYVHRPFRLSYGSSEVVTRPRTDGAVFLQAGIPAMSLGAIGSKPTPYHQPDDDMSYVEIDIMRDAVKLVATSLILWANH